jgi:hypothetical protein
MKEIKHPKYGQCYELIEPKDIDFSAIAQAALVNETVLPSGTITPTGNFWIREKYLVSEEYRPENGPLP